MISCVQLLLFPLPLQLISQPHLRLKICNRKRQLFTWKFSNRCDLIGLNGDVPGLYLFRLFRLERGTREEGDILALPGTSDRIACDQLNACLSSFVGKVLTSGVVRGIIPKFFVGVQRGLRQIERFVGFIFDREDRVLNRVVG